MSKRKLITAAALCLFVVFGLTACTDTTINGPDIISGGVTDKTDFNAPKTIESKEITTFYCSCMLPTNWEDHSYYDRYTFEIKPDASGNLALTFIQNDSSIPATEELLASVQEVIDNHNLAQYNGVDRVTAGLPPEFQSCTFEVTYASGEELAFTMNGDPFYEWGEELYNIFDSWFKEAGLNSPLP